MKKTTTGFTIVELLIVIVVIAILAAISIAAYTGMQVRANISVINADLSQVNKALKTYHAVHGIYPIHLGWVSQTPSSKNTFISGLVPDSVSALPLPPQVEGAPRLFYRTDADGVNYKLLYLYPSTESMPSSIASNASVVSLLDPVRPTRGWGYWTSGAAAF